MQFHLLLVELGTVNINVKKYIFFNKEPIYSLCPILPFFPSISVERVSFLLQGWNLHQSSKSHSLPPLLRFSCINNSLFSFALSIAASLDFSSQPTNGHISFCYWKQLPKAEVCTATVNYVPRLTHSKESLRLVSTSTYVKPFLETKLLCSA